VDDPAPSPLPAPPGWWAKVASKLPLDLPLALLAREMNLYLHHQANKQPNKQASDKSSQGAKAFSHLFTTRQMGLFDYRTLHQSNDPVKKGAGGLGKEAEDRQSSISSFNSAVMSHVTQPCSTNATAVSSKIDVVGSSEDKAEREALAALMGMRNSPPRRMALPQAAPPLPPPASFPVVQFQSPPSAAPSTPPVNSEVQHLSATLQIEEALEAMDRDMRRLRGLQRSLVASFVQRMADSYEPHEAARALCCAWPHSVLNAADLLAEYEQRAVQCGLLFPLQPQA
jgi:hypothetical protein